MKMAILNNKKRIKKPRVNIHFGKIVLVLLLVLGQVLIISSNKVDASDQLYYYDKYESKVIGWGPEQRQRMTGYSMSAWEHYNGVPDPVWSDYYGGYIFSEGSGSAGHFNVYAMVKPNYPGFSPSNYYISGWRYTEGFYTEYTKIWRDPIYAKGVLNQANIIAIVTEYPVDGLHTDGFWYVRKGVVNSNPTLISLISGGVVSGGNSYFSKINQA